MNLHSRTALVAVLAASSVVHAAGFQLGEEGAAATGMVGAFTAKADDATAIFYNPAGIAKLRGPQVYVGGMAVIGQSQASSTAAFQIPGGPEDSHQVFSFVPNTYLAWGLPRDFAIGLGFFTNFGLKVTWPINWAGRFESTYANLENVTINPCIAWQLSPWFAIGGGVDITPARVQLRRVENLIDAEATLRFQGNALGAGGNVAVLFQVPRKNRPSPFTIGLSYRSRTTLDFDGAALIVNNVPLELSGVLHDTKASTTLRLPDLISVGVGGRPVDRLFLQLQFDWTNWSSLQTLQLNAQDSALNLSIPENWRDGYTMRIGGEYAFRRVSARLGFGVDWTPVPQSTLSPVIPDSTRFLVSTGATAYLTKGFALEGALMGVIFRSRTSELTTFPVEYSTWAVLLSVAVSYRSPQADKAHPSSARP